MKKIVLLILSCFMLFSAQAQHSVAREWNEILLGGIRGDFARPTVHARNLFHISAAMYDAWAAYDDVAVPYLLGNEINGFNCSFNGVATPPDIQAAQEEALSYAVYRILLHRFQNSPGTDELTAAADQYMMDLGYNISFTSINYTTGNPAALGNYIASCYIDFGLQDGANEAGEYENISYQPINDPLRPDNPGNPDITDPNRWQPLTLAVFIDQAGNEIPISTPEFLSPEWGAVIPFSLKEEDKTIYERDGFEYYVYHDPGLPALIDPENQSGTTASYQWGHSLVAYWSSHLDPADGVMIDISPGSIGNINQNNYPSTIEELNNFYDLENGGDPSQGHAINPTTGMPYEQQIVPRGDYTRVLAEFWADGPDSETPPGHWFTILNYVNDYPGFEKRYKGEGPELDDLEWDVKSYFVLGGTMHDVAIASWGIKGWYDYARPVSAIRYMADQGQSTDPMAFNYDPNGLPLYPGIIETVELGDPLAGSMNENVGKIKIYGWRGPDYIVEPETDAAGVDWILAENWWPYQRPSFVTPPFAGYVSGHSTYSRAAAEVMTLLTGDAYFPGGMGEFIAPQNEFLVFEEGPSVDVVLQWATYVDASEQCSLSRIWGGIHPPVDDIPGRLIGLKIGPDAFEYADSFFDGSAPVVGLPDNYTYQQLNTYPNPVTYGELISIQLTSNDSEIQIFDVQGRLVYENELNRQPESQILKISSRLLKKGLFIVKVKNDDQISTSKILIE